MIEASLQYPYTALKAVADCLMQLPTELRPLTARTADDRPIVALTDYTSLASYIEGRDLGFFLEAPKCHYNFSIAGKRPIILDCSLNISCALARKFMFDMSLAEPIFGYSCNEEEVSRKNLIKIKIGMNAIESWLGQDFTKKIPGLYWITVISSELLNSHNISVSSLIEIAQEYREIGGKAHIFRFYSTPEDWVSSKGDIILQAPLPSIFDIEKVRKSAMRVHSVQEWLRVSLAWR